MSEKNAKKCLKNVASGEREAANGVRMCTSRKLHFFHPSSFCFRTCYIVNLVELQALPPVACFQTLRWDVNHCVHTMQGLLWNPSYPGPCCTMPQARTYRQELTAERRISLALRGMLSPPIPQWTIPLFGSLHATPLKRGETQRPPSGVLRARPLDRGIVIDLGLCK